MLVGCGFVFPLLNTLAVITAFEIKLEAPNNTSELTRNAINPTKSSNHRILVQNMTGKSKVTKEHQSSVSQITGAATTCLLNTTKEIPMKTGIESLNSDQKTKEGSCATPTSKPTKNSSTNTSDTYYNRYKKIVDKYEIIEFGDFDEHVDQIDFNDFGSNYGSEISFDKENFDYYFYKDTIMKEMKGQYDTFQYKEEAPPPPDYVFYEEKDYDDFGTIFIDEQEVDMEEYYESLRYFELIDNLTDNKQRSFNFRM